MDWNMLSEASFKRLVIGLALLIAFNVSPFSNAMGQVFESAQHGYTVEVLGTYNLNSLTSAMDQGDWDVYRKVSMPVDLMFDEGTKVRLHPANSRPQPNLSLAIPDSDILAPRTFSLTTSGHILVLSANLNKH